MMYGLHTETEGRSFGKKGTSTVGTRSVNLVNTNKLQKQPVRKRVWLFSVLKRIKLSWLLFFYSKAIWPRKLITENISLNLQFQGFRVHEGQRQEELGTHILIYSRRKREGCSKRYEAFGTSKPAPSHLTPAKLHLLTLSKQPLTGDQVLKHRSIWWSSPFKPPHA